MTVDHAVQRIGLERPSAGSLRAFFALAVAVPVALVLGATWTTQGAPSPTLLALALAVVVAAWVASLRLLRRHHMQLDAAGVEVATTFYRRRVDASELDLHAARVVDLDERPELRPGLKTNGVGFPGFASGWYRLRGGGKALVAIAGGPRVLWLPTRKGYGLLLQPPQPQALLDRLRAMAAAGDRR